MRIIALQQILMIITIIVCSCWTSCCYGAATADHDVNDLNHALRQVIGEMYEDNYFQSLWYDFFKANGTNIRNGCDNAQIVNISTADESLTTVVESGILRVGLIARFAAVPLLYSVQHTDDSTNASNSTNSTSLAEARSSENEGTTTLVLTDGEPDGYEVRSVKEATRRLSLIYEKEIQPQFVVIDTYEFEDSAVFGIDKYFAAVVNGLNEKVYDVAWTGLFVVEDRNTYVDYVCPTVFTELIVLSDGTIPKETPDPDGEPIKVACVGTRCDLKIPQPFVLVKVDVPVDQYKSIHFVDDDIHCILDNKEDFFYPNRTYCLDCFMVGTTPVAELLRGPATRKVVPINIPYTSNDDTDTNVSTSDTILIVKTIVSNLIVWYLFVSGIWFFHW